MKIALLGYGRMGKEIEKIALQRGHEIVIKTSGKEDYDITQADIAIDFSIPDSAFKNISNCIDNQSSCYFWNNRLAKQIRFNC